MNKIEKSELTVAELANGQALTVPVYRLAGQGEGPSVYIQANIHGAEVQGNAVIYQLLEQLQRLQCWGDITLVPLANPIGTNQKSGEFTLGRFDPITGVNWNRGYHHNASLAAQFAAANPELTEAGIKAGFREALLADLDQRLEHDPYGMTTGQRLACLLQRMATQADIVLDLHTGPVSSRHLYCPEYARDMAGYFDIPHVLLIPNEFDGAMDEACFCPWWQLQQAYQQQGRSLAVMVEAFTLELGSQEWLCLEAAREDSDSVLAYLSHRGAVGGGEFRPRQMTRYACYLKDYRAFYAPKSGMVEYLAPLGEPLKAGEPLVRMLRIERYGEPDAVEVFGAPEDCIPVLHFASASVNQGTELYKVFSNYSTLDDLP